MDSSDINIIAWWIVILILAFASIGVYTVFQILRTVWKKEPPPDGLGDGWPPDRFCILLRVPQLGTPAVGDEPAVPGKLRIEFKVVDVQPDGSERPYSVTNTFSGLSNGPYHRMYSWNPTSAEMTAEDTR